MKIIVLGTGRVGSLIAADLAADKRFRVTVADINPKSLDNMKRKFALNTITSDLADQNKLIKLYKMFDMVVDALPGHFGFNAFKTAIEEGKQIVDIAFFEEDPFILESKARRKKVIAIMDCGLAPGLSNILIGHLSRTLDEIESASIYVGGLPVIRQWPYEYKAVFSPADVIEEYIRPARYLENGRMVTREALSDREYIDFPEVGTLEAFNTDGLRTLMKTISAPKMKEKTLRYPGHSEKIAVLRDTGLFSKVPIEVNGVKIKPIDFTSRLLFPKWELQEYEEDITIMRVIVDGYQNKKKYKYTFELIDRYDSNTKFTSMARTTGYTASIVVRLVAEGVYDQAGVSPPEYIGRRQNCVDFLLKELGNRGIKIQKRAEILS
jgi:saccharopine dehydrogenase-like NADP-dependent oxidoreductase